MSTIVHKKTRRGFVVCIAYDKPYREYPIYHGPRIDPRFSHPYFPGTVLPYVAASDCTSGREHEGTTA